MVFRNVGAISQKTVITVTAVKTLQKTAFVCSILEKKSLISSASSKFAINCPVQLETR
jgi:hypothetical protein